MLSTFLNSFSGTLGSKFEKGIIISNGSEAL